MNTLTVPQLKEMMRYVADEIIAQKDALCRIDAEIGDGDHGIGMEHGFTKVKEVLLDRDFATANELFQNIGMAMIGAMGGASGVLFGSMFLGASKTQSRTEVDLAAFSQMADAALEAVKQRGKAEPGDKTMVDALQPACEAMRVPTEDFTTLLSAAADAAGQGVEATKQYVAKFGRAKSLMERAVGHQDAGATTVWMILCAMRDWCKNQ